MNKEYIKYVFLLSFLSIACKGLLLGFDLASGLALLIAGSLVFGYEFISSQSQFAEIKAQLQHLESRNEEIVKEIQQLKTNRNIQNIASPKTMMGSGANFPPRLG